MKHKKSLIVLIILATVSIIACIPLVAQASWWDSLFGEDTESIVEFLLNHSDWLQYVNYFSFAGHIIGWFTVQGLYFFVGFLEDLIPQSLSLMTFLEDAGMESLAASIINDLVVALMVLTIVIIGFKVIIAKEPPKFKNIGVNIAISAILIIGLPSFMKMMEDISIEFLDASQTGTDGDTEGIAWGLVKDNTADLFYVMTNGFDLIENGSSGNVKNTLTPDKFKAANMSEIITPKVVDKIDTSDSDESSINALKYTLSLDGDGNYAAAEIENGMMTNVMGGVESGYFRYPTKFAPIIFGLFALGIAYAFTIFVLITTIIEIGIKRIVGMFVFATDLESGQKTKMVVRDIINAFLLIAFTGLNLKFYTLFLSYLASTDINLLLYIIAMICASFVLIRGSSTIMRYFGVDVGLKDGLGQIIGAAAAMKAAGSVGKLAFGGNKNKPKKDSNKPPNHAEDSPSNGGNSVDSGSPSGESNQLLGKGSRLRNNLSKSINGNTLAKPNDSVGNVDSIGSNEGKTAQSSIEGESKSSMQDKNNQTDKLNGIENSQSPSGDGVSDNQKGNKRPDTEFNSGTGKAELKKSSVSEGESNNNNNGENKRPNTEINTATGQPGAKKSSLNEGEGGIDKENKRPGTEINTATGQPGAKKSSLNEGESGIDKENKRPGTEINTATGQPGAKKSSLNEGESGIDRENKRPGTEFNTATGQPGAKKSSINEGESSNNSENHRPGSEFNSATGKPKTNQSINEGTQGANKEQPSLNNSNGSSHKQRIEREYDQGRDLSPASKVESSQAKPNLNSQMGNAGEFKGQINADVKSNGKSSLNAEGANNLKQVSQKIVQEVAQTSFSNPQEATRRIIQKVEKENFSNSTQKQQVIQEIKQASNATPAQAKQNIEQVLSTGNLPSEVKSSVQKVVQDLTTNGSNTADIKQKVIQEVQRATGSSDAVKQNVIQNVEKAFSATPQQLEQNIKQTISHIGSGSLPDQVKTQVTEQKVITSHEDRSYFGKILDQTNKPTTSSNKKSRFDKFKDKE